MIIKNLAIITILIFNASFPQTRWEKLNGPEGGYITSIFTQGDTIIAGAGFGKSMLFYSLDRGLTWDQSTFRFSGFGNPVPITAITVTEDKGIMAVPLDQNLFKSFDFNNWFKSGTHRGRFLTKDTSGILYSGTSFGYVMSSSNNGISWTEDYYFQSGISDFITTTNNIVFVGALKKILKKENDNWTIIPMDSLGTSIKLFLDQNGDIFAYSDNHIYKSTDNGSSWSLHTFFPNEDLDASIYNHRFICGFNDETGWGGNNWGIQVSDDNGSTWYPSNNGLPPRFSSAHILAKSGNDTFLGTLAAGIYKSTDFGATWYSANRGLTASETRDVILTKDNILWTASWSNGIQRSTDKGETWEAKNEGLGNIYSYAIIEDNNGNMFCGTEEGVYISRDNGESWSRTSIAGNDLCYHLYKDNKNRIYSLNIGSGIHRTTDEGMTWQRIDQGFASPLIFGFEIDRNDNIYAGTPGGWIYKSTDDGQSWNVVKSGLGYNVRIREAPNGYIFVTNNEEGILRSSDGGQSWQPVNNGITGRNGKSLRIDKDGLILATVAEVLGFLPAPEKLYVSRDNGDNWENYTSNLGLITVYEILFDSENNVYLATDESLWRSDPDSATFVSNYPLNLPDYRLDQNYPNPFNPSTTISYSIPKQEYVTLSVYNILGEEIAKLVQEIKSQGSYSVRFESADLPGGVYIYRLKTEGFTSARKMILTK